MTLLWPVKVLSSVTNLFFMYLIGQTVWCLNKLTSSKFLTPDIRHSGQNAGVFADADHANRLYWGLGCWHFWGVFRDVGVGETSYNLLTTFWNYWFPKWKKCESSIIFIIVMYFSYFCDYSFVYSVKDQPYFWGSQIILAVSIYQNTLFHFTFNALYSRHIVFHSGLIKHMNLLQCTKQTGFYYWFMTCINYSFNICYLKVVARTFFFLFVRQ